MTLRVTIPARLGRFDHIFRIASVSIFTLIILVSGARALIKERAIHAFVRAYSTETTFTAQRAAYLSLLQTIGAVPAEEAFHEHFPDTAHNHVVNHSAGTFIYKTEGVNGVIDCRSYFTGSCYHGFVTSLIADHGINDLSLLAATCAKAISPQERLNCAHGLGHGLSEAADHDMVRALDLCRQTFAASSTDIQFCFYGVSMENRDLGDTASSSAYLYDAKDPMYPCDLPAVVARGAHVSCWVTQSQSILRSDRYQSVIGGDIGKASRYCDSLTDVRDRETCMSGVAAQILFRLNDVIVKNDPACNAASLEAGSDTCHLTPTDEQINTACRAMQTRQDSMECVWGVHRFMYYFGDRSAALMHSCASETTHKDECYASTFYRAIQMTYATAADQRNACETLPEKTYVNTCMGSTTPAISGGN